LRKGSEDYVYDLPRVEFITGFTGNKVLKGYNENHSAQVDKGSYTGEVFENKGGN